MPDQKLILHKKLHRVEIDRYPDNLLLNFIHFDAGSLVLKAVLLFSGVWKCSIALCNACYGPFMHVWWDFAGMFYHS